MTKKTLWWSLLLALAGLMVALAEGSGPGGGGPKTSLDHTLLVEGSGPGGGGPKPG